MANTTKATFYLDAGVYRAFKVKAALSDKKISDLMNETLRAQLREDQEDIKAIRQRSNDVTETLEEFLASLD